MNFAPKELVERARKLGFDGKLYFEETNEVVSYDDGGVFIEQLRVWLWEKVMISVVIARCFGNKYVCNVYTIDNYLSTNVPTEPFTAELEGVTKAIEYLEENK